jgi:uncharacterized zinc-type alcohol dehydrogenase-like protein
MLGLTTYLDTGAKSRSQKLTGSLNLVLSTIMAEVDMTSYLAALAPRGRFHNGGRDSEYNDWRVPVDCRAEGDFG